MILPKDLESVDNAMLARLTEKVAFKLMLKDPRWEKFIL
jgi:hypothetical protein